MKKVDVRKNTGWDGQPIVKETKQLITINTPPDEEIELNLFSWGEVKQWLIPGLMLKKFKKYLYGGMVFEKIPK